MELHPIGRIYAPFKNKTDCPIQPAYTAETEGTVDVFDESAAGLKDIEMFSNIYMLYQFDRAGEIQLVRPTFLDDAPHGIYASRHPCRPNGIGLSIVRLKERQANTLIIGGVDMLDGTPLLDMKPYIPRFDVIASASEGWLKNRQWRPKPADRE